MSVSSFSSSVLLFLVSSLFVLSVSVQADGYVRYSTNATACQAGNSFLTMIYYSACTANPGTNATATQSTRVECKGDTMFVYTYNDLTCATLSPNQTRTFVLGSCQATGGSGQEPYAMNYYSATCSNQANNLYSINWYVMTIIVITACISIGF